MSHTFGKHTYDFYLDVRSERSCTRSLRMTIDGRSVGGESPDGLSYSDASEIVGSDLITDQMIALSIAKWQTIASALEQQVASGADPDEQKFIPDGGKWTCALCLGYGGRRTRCAGCPVLRATGLGACLNTPYQTYYSISSLVKNTAPAQLSAARAEVAFLTAVREAHASCFTCTTCRYAHTFPALPATATEPAEEPFWACELSPSQPCHTASELSPKHWAGCCVYLMAFDHATYNAHNKESYRD